MAFYVYMLRGVDYSYYVGHTDDLDQGIAQHHAGDIAAYTQNRRPRRPVFIQEFATREEALSAERQLKGWSRAKKEARSFRTGSGSSNLLRIETRRRLLSKYEALRQAQGEPIQGLRRGRIRRTREALERS